MQRWSQSWHFEGFEFGRILWDKNCVVMEFAEMNYYKCKIEDEENTGGFFRPCAGPDPESFWPRVLPCGFWI